MHWPVHAILLFSLVAAASCGEKAKPPGPPPVAPETKVVFRLNTDESGNYELTTKQAQWFIALINSPPDSATEIEIVEGADPPGIFLVENRRYEFHGALICSEGGVEYVWKHPFLDALWLPPGLDELPAFFETMKNYDWPATE